MATVMSRPGRESRSPRVHAKRRVHSPKSVLMPESLDTSSESSSLASSTLGEQIVECTSFRNPSKIKEPSNDPSKLAAAEASFEHVDSYTWFLSIDRPSDLLVEVDGISFQLHKLPILSRSGLLFRLASRSCESRRAYINLVDFPGGAEAFILVAKFCYGIVEELTPTNVASIRCAAEHLEMTEAFEEGNVVSKAEAYLDLVILNSWQESIIVLQSCELLLPWAEDMELVKRCAQSVALKACTDPRGVRWLFSGSSSTAPRSLLEGSVSRPAPKGWWYEDVSHLTIYCFGEVMEAIKECEEMDSELVGGALEYYAQRWLPGLVKPAPGSTGSAASTGKNSPASSPRKDIVVYHSGASKRGALRLEDPGGAIKVHESIAEQNRNRFILEEIVGMLPPQRDAVSCSFLLRMTRAAYMLNCDSDCKAELERRAGALLDQALLSDLLIPCFSHTSEYLYDIDLVRRILDHFLSQEQSIASSLTSCSGDRVSPGCVYDGQSPAPTPPPARTSRAKVAKLVDSYLAEVARDSKLPLSKFQFLAEALPVGSRLCDDGLYRAVDTYLKIHPTLTEHERKRLCRVLNCHRLSLDACTHASQNERLPLRFVVQVLFCEQLKIRSTVTEVGISVKEERSNPDDASVASREATADSHGQQQQSTASNYSAGANGNHAVQESINQMEIRALQRELASMRVKYNDLERDQGNIQHQVHQISRVSRARSSSWSSGAWKKISKLHLFSSSQSKDSTPSDSGRTEESRDRTNPRRWRNSIS